MESNDQLNLQNDKEIEKLIPFDIGKALRRVKDLLEPILFSAKIFKINRWSLKQDRILVLTVRSVYVFRKKCTHQQQQTFTTRIVFLFQKHLVKISCRTQKKAEDRGTGMRDKELAVE